MARILIVDDEENIRYSLRLVLEGAGHELMEACNGVEAQTVLKDNAFDLVITDIVMPEQEGMELIMGINERFPDTKVIAITGGGKKINLQAALDPVTDNAAEDAGNEQMYLETAAVLGANDTLLKPIDIDTLLSSVDKCLSDAAGPRV